MQRNGNGEGKGRQEERTSYYLDRALARRVLAGASPQLLWARSSEIDFEQLPESSLLRQEFKKAEAESRIQLERRVRSFGWASAMWFGLRRLCIEWFRGARKRPVSLR